MTYIYAKTIPPQKKQPARAMIVSCFAPFDTQAPEKLLLAPGIEAERI